METIKRYIRKYCKSIVIINIILLIISIGFGDNGVLNEFIIFSLFILLAFMPEELFEDNE